MRNAGASPLSRDDARIPPEDRALEGFQSSAAKMALISLIVSRVLSQPVARHSQFTLVWLLMVAVLRDAMASASQANLPGLPPEIPAGEAGDVFAGLAVVRRAWADTPAGAVGPDAEVPTHFPAEAGSDAGLMAEPGAAEAAVEPLAPNSDDAAEFELAAAEPTAPAEGQPASAGSSDDVPPSGNPAEAPVASEQPEPAKTEEETEPEIPKVPPVLPAGGGGGGGGTLVGTGSGGAAGSVIKGYLDHAVVWRDKNGNGQFDYIDANENAVFDDGEQVQDYAVYTDVLGGYAGLGGNGAIHVFGGTDTNGTGLVFQSLLLAPETATVVTSLTTLIQSVRQAGLPLGDAVDKVSALLGLDASVTDADLLNTDPISQAYYGATAADRSKYLSIYAASAQVANLLVVGTAALQQAVPGASLDQAATALLTALGNALAGAAPQTVIDLGSSEFLRSVIAASEIDGQAIVVPNLDAIATSLANVNQQVALIAADADTNSMAALTALVATEYASQYNLSNDIRGVNGQSLDAANYSGANLAALFDSIEVVVGSVVAPVAGGRGQPDVAVLMDAANADTPIGRLGAEQLADDHPYHLSQKLNRDVLAGDLFKVLVDGVTVLTHEVTAEEASAGQLLLSLNGSVWGLNGQPVQEQRLLVTRLDTAAGLEGAVSRHVPLWLDNVVTTPAVDWALLQDSATQGDSLTNTGQTLTISLAEAGATLSFSVSKNGEPASEVTLLAPADSFDLDASAIGIQGPGRYAVTLSQVDAAGNASGTSEPRLLTVDQTAPQLSAPLDDALLGQAELAGFQMGLVIDDATTARPLAEARFIGTHDGGDR